ncbi:hypothetical protein PV08_05402 [Exophiala spinifera]|uniref:Gfd2/YDR514C-like C-terminal domain-containing protein n=1 Tax=Exophiala spinifera TaxID=91928 RepID=A0A0D1YK43_9EURO|nr:uncharacterized protein PV08_05402 [Exophiala spinifera]KIW15356.1 hypothetical protein PV08_05402 [Exophiala spinifera]
MNTSPQTRLNRLFAGKPLPTPPVPGELHFSEKELKENIEQSRKTPATVQHPQKAPSPPKPQSTSATDGWSSADDDDDSVAAFRPKPSMKAPTQQPDQKLTSRTILESTARASREGVSTEAESSSGSVCQSNNPSKVMADEKQGSIAHGQIQSIPDSEEQNPETTRQYCQFLLAAKFPYKYMNDGDDRVSKRFFANNKFYNRDWDIYYLHPPFSLGSKPIILVPYAQVHKLVTEIGEAFKVEVSVPDFPFTVKFSDDGTPQPQFLGNSKSRDQFMSLQNSIDLPSKGHGECPANASPHLAQQFVSFRELCLDALAAHKKKSGGGKSTTKKKEGDRLLSTHDFNSQLRRLQRYFGLRAKSVKSQPPEIHPSWTGKDELRQPLEKTVMETLHVNEVAPYPFEKEPVFISVDIESYERAHNLITEVGVSTLDTLDLIDTPPGENGKNWINCIRSRHFRIKDHAHLVNRDFCVGNPDAFQFGRSEWVTLQQAPTEVDNCLKWPFSVQYKYAGLKDAWDTESTPVSRMTSGSSESSEAIAGKSAAGDCSVDPSQDPNLLQRGPKDRNIILVGHDIRSDLDYLRTLGSKIFTPSRGAYPVAAMEAVDEGSDTTRILSSIVEALDTAPLYKAYKNESQPRNLGAIGTNLGLQCFFMHNGGNDARYTLEALVALAIQARLVEDAESPSKEGSSADQAIRSKSDRSGGLGADNAAGDVGAITERLSLETSANGEGEEGEEEWEL